MVFCGPVLGDWLEWAIRVFWNVEHILYLAYRNTFIETNQIVHLKWMLSIAYKSHVIRVDFKESKA